MDAVDKKLRSGGGGGVDAVEDLLVNVGSMEMSSGIYIFLKKNIRAHDICIRVIGRRGGLWAGYCSIPSGGGEGWQHFMRA